MLIYYSLNGTIICIMKIMKIMKKFIVPLLKISALVLIFAVSIAVYAFFVEPQLLTVKHYTIENKALAGTRLVFASDFHIKKNQQNRLKSIVNLINSSYPDIIVLGGDFVNGYDREDNIQPAEMTKELSKLRAPYGVYAVVGNHDRWYGVERVKSVLKNSGIMLLLNENKQIKLQSKKFFLAGADDPLTGEPDIKRALKNSKKPVVFVTHSPDIFPQIPSGVDLVLAGHTHGGQVVVPFIGPVVVPSEYGSSYAFGKIESNGKVMIVTKGLGTSVLHVRFNCLPEIVVVDFV